MRRIRFLRALAAGIVFAAVLTAAVAAGLLRDGRELDARAGELAVLIALGAAPAGALTLIATDYFAARASALLRALVAAACATLLGGAALAGLYGLHFYWNAYGEQGDLTELGGWIGLAYIVAQGVVYFAIFGFRLLWPWGMLGIVLVTLLAAPRPRLPAGAPNARPAPPV